MKLVFTGDISFSRFFEDGYKGEGCVSPPVRDFLASADWVVANVECPLTKRGVESARPLNHSSDPEAGRYLRGLNASIWNLANNHVMDCGPEGLLDTLRCAEENGCKTLGAGRNLAEAVRPVIVDDSVKVGILSCAKPWRHVKAGEETPGALTCDRVDVLKEGLADLRRRVDWIVLVVHGEDEFNNMPMPYTRKRYLEMLSWGADIIVAHHPHVVQNHERVGEKPFSIRSATSFSTRKTSGSSSTRTPAFFWRSISKKENTRFPAFRYGSTGRKTWWNRVPCRRFFAISAAATTASCGRWKPAGSCLSNAGGA